MELFEFRGEDITEDEDQGIIRRIVTRGQGYSKPNEGAAVEGNAPRQSFFIALKKNNLFTRGCFFFLRESKIVIVYTHVRLYLTVMYSHHVLHCKLTLL